MTPAVDPFTRSFRRCIREGNDSFCRLRLAHRFSYVLPEPDLLRAILRRSPIVELAAGTGYWACLLRRLGADVVAYDMAPSGGQRENRYHPEARSWTEVLEGDERALARHPDRSLFVCWPPVFSSIWECLRFYAGEIVIYVGDGGPRTCHLARLEADFTSTESYEVTAMDQEPGRPGALSVWQRTRARPGQLRDPPCEIEIS